jgi:hypothetical protein
MADALKQLIVFILILALITTGVASALWYTGAAKAHMSRHGPANSGNNEECEQDCYFTYSMCMNLCHPSIERCEEGCTEDYQDCLSHC